MKKKLILTLAIAAILWICEPVSASLDTGLVGHWTFDEGAGNTVTDATTTGNNGTVYGAAWDNGISGKALRFNGSDDYIQCAYEGPMGASARTVSFWAKTSVVDQQVVLSYGANDPFGASFRVGLPAWKFDEGAGVDVSGGAITYSATVADDNWHFYAFVVPGISNPQVSDCLVFQDDKLLTTVSDSILTETSIDTQTDSPICIGRYFGGTRYFNGILDDVRIYDRALSENEVVELYETTPEPATLLLFALGSLALRTKHRS